MYVVGIQVGWHAVYEEADRLCHKLLNALSFGLVLAVIILGYVLQFASCFRRDSAFMPKVKINSLTTHQRGWCLLVLG